jgi:hypothetical protein
MPAFPGGFFEPSATEWNRMVSSSRKLPQSRHTRRTFQFANQPQFSWIVNSCGEDRDQYDILKIEEPFVSPTDDDQGFRERIVWKGVEPTAHCQFAVLLYPALEGELVPCLTTGQVQARVQITDASITPCFRAGPKSGSYRLHQLATGSAEATWAESGTGDKWTILNLAQHRQVLCKTVAPILKGTFGECVCYWGDFPSEFPAGESITGINRFGNIGAEKWCIATWLLNHWYIKAAEC